MLMTKQGGSLSTKQTNRRRTLTRKPERSHLQLVNECCYAITFTRGGIKSRTFGGPEHFEVVEQPDTNTAVFMVEPADLSGSRHLVNRTEIRNCDIPKGQENKFSKHGKCPPEGFPDTDSDASSDASDDWDYTMS